MLTPHRFRPRIDSHEAPAPPLAFSDAAAATAWFGAEQASLVAVCRLAAAEGWSAACWQLAYALRGYLFLAKAWDAWIQTHRVALDAATGSGDRWAEAVTASNLGLALVERGRLRPAQELYHRSMTIFRRLGDKIGEAGTLGHQAWVAFCLGDVESCYERASAALAIYEAGGVRRNTAITLRTVALAESRLGRSADARLHLEQALDLALELDLPLDAAMACNDLGYVHLDRADLQEARRWYVRGLRLSESCGSDYEQARAYEGLATVAAGVDRPRAAARFRQRALDRYETLNAPEAARLRG
jgi:tetratricopeptide (TPR) repeat protein